MMGQDWKLETPRLYVREAVAADTDFIFALLNSANWLEYIGDRGIRTLSDAKAYIDNQLIAAYTDLGFGLYLMIEKTGQTPIGLCGFLQRDYLDHPDIGFAISPEFEGQGYTTEAGRSMMAYGRDQLGFTKILAITTATNHGSQQVLTKLGLHPNGTVLHPVEKNELLVFTSDIPVG